MQNPQIDPQKIIQLRNIIFDNKFPVENVTIHGIPFQFILSDKAPTLNISAQVDFFENVMKYAGISGRTFFKKLPQVFFQPIVDAYISFQMCLCREFFGLMQDFVKTPESRGLWAVYKRSNPEHIMTIDGKLNMFQQRWIASNVSLDNTDNAHMILEILNVLKPWLDKEMFVKLQEEEKDMRENAFYNEDDLKKMDERLREKAKKIARDRVKSPLCDANDLDTTIIIGDK